MGVDVQHYNPLTFRKLLAECIPHLRVVVLYLLLAKASGMFSEVFPLLFVGLGILSLYYVGWKATLKKRSEKSLKYSYGQGDLAMECSCVFALFLMFALFFQDLHRQFPGFFRVQEGATYLNWLVFTIENIFESIFDVLSVYEIKISGIRAMDNVAKTLILFFRFTVNVVVLILIVRNWRNFRVYWQVNKKRLF
ncbi:MAG: hypothetical protein R3B74_14565 [Nitrospirales bacterium]|nr:hypothetical protein [Nitrospirales bacterium]